MSQKPSDTQLPKTGQLVLTGYMFGIGWGLGGYCPGPALAGLGFGSGETIAFVAAMLLGMIAARRSSKFFSRLAWRTKSSA